MAVMFLIIITATFPYMVALYIEGQNEANIAASRPRSKCFLVCAKKARFKVCAYPSLSDAHVNSIGTSEAMFKFAVCITCVRKFHNPSLASPAQCSPDTTSLLYTSPTHYALYRLLHKQTDEPAVQLVSD